VNADSDPHAVALTARVIRPDHHRMVDPARHPVIKARSPLSRYGWNNAVRCGLFSDPCATRITALFLHSIFRVSWKRVEQE
jgi:hypothetical protein